MIEKAFISAGIGDITPVLAGAEACYPNQKTGPAVRDCYLMYFCISGRGRLVDASGTHEVGAGEMFVVRRGEVTSYQADAADPWEYVWLGFVGERAEIFSTAASVYKTPQGLDRRLYCVINDGVNSPEIYIAIIYELIHCLFSASDTDDTPTDRLRRIHRYVRYNYMKPLSVGELARTFGFERSYLFRIFKDRYGVGLKEYITSVRMTNAARLLDEGYSVREVASMVGYEDPFNFSKAFKGYYGTPPSKYGK